MMKKVKNHLPNRICHLNDRFLFGKFNGTTLGEILMYAPDYLTWVVENVDGKYFKLEDSAIVEIQAVFPDFRITDDFECKRLEQLNSVSDDYYDYNESHEYFDDNAWIEQPTFENYRGSYAQDVMGYSDDEIDIIFDGDPLAYWNID